MTKFKRTEEENDDLTPCKRRKTAQTTLETSKEEIEGKAFRRPTKSNDHEQLVSLHQRRRKNPEKEISVEPAKEIEPDSESSPSKSIYTTPKTTNSIYETPPAFPMDGSRSYEEGKSLQSETSGSGGTQPFAVLGLGSEEQDQYGAAKEAVTLNESDDEAPETITKESAKEQVKRLDVEAAKASHRQVAAEKVRRREKDARLKQQASFARRKEKPNALSPVNSQLPTGTEGTAITDGSPMTNRKKRHIPEYLPEEILAMEPSLEVSTALTALNGDERESQRRKRNIYFPDEKKAKDVKRGSLKVRVLNNENELLPPKANPQSRHIRETWLRGRPGKRGETMFERRSINKSFHVK